MRKYLCSLVERIIYNDSKKKKYRKRRVKRREGGREKEGGKEGEMVGGDEARMEDLILFNTTPLDSTSL